MSTHPNDGTRAGKASRELLDLTLNLVDRVHPTEYGAIKAYLDALAAYPNTAGSARLKSALDAEVSGAPTTRDCDLIVTSWSFGVEALRAVRAVRAKRPEEACRAIINGTICYAMRAGIEIAEGRANASPTPKT